MGRMDQATAERWVVISAALVAGIYGYRRITEPVAAPTAGGKVKAAIGLGNPLPLGAFVTAWGFTYLVVSILASANPGLGGSFAMLIATGDFLTNATSVLGDVAKQERPSAGLGKIGSTLGSAVNNPNATAGLPGNPAITGALTPGGITAPAGGGQSTLTGGSTTSNAGHGQVP